ncbi:MAG: hypothetical protein OEZ36_08110 [Spirochaetota bacterium]|nr:hypothetical protein [Spirochaetota bacterium]
MSWKSWIGVFAICLLSYEMLGAPANSTELYMQVKRAYFKNLPRDFVANVSGSEIDKSVKKIPADSHCGGKKPKVTYLFLKGQEESIIVENVENPFVTRFQTHLEVYKSAKSFLDRTKSYSDIQKVFQWDYLPGQSARYYVVKMRKHRVRKSDYFLLEIDKRNYSIVRAVQYSHGKAIATINVSYQYTGQYLLPHIISVKINKDKAKRNFQLKMTGHKLNLGLNSDKIIDLQNDCPSI